MGEVTDIHIGQRILEHAKSCPDAPCVETEGTVTTRSEMVARASALKGLFLGFGIAKGDSVAVLCATAARSMEAALALWDLRARVVFLDPRQSEADMNAICASAQVSVKFSDLPTFRRRPDFETIPREIGLSKTQLSFATCQSEDDAIVFTSSGTTGTPKVRGVTHNGLVTRIKNVNRTVGVDNAQSMYRLLIGNLAFAAVSFAWIRWLFLGAPILDLPSFFLTKDVHQALSRADVGVASLSPFAFRLSPVALRELIHFHDANAEVSSVPAFPHLKQLRTVGGPVPKKDLQRAFEVLTPNVESSYSLSGVGPVSRLMGREANEKGASVGRPFDGIVVRVIDQNNQVLPLGHVGRVFAQNTLHPNATEIETGDIGYIDEDGFLFLTGRAQQNATRQSVNVNLTDLEADIRSLDEVRDCLAFAITDPETGDDVVFLAVESELGETVLRALIKKAVSSYRRPDRMYITSKLPRNAAEKISLRDLKTKAEEGGETFVSF